MGNNGFVTTGKITQIKHDDLYSSVVLSRYVLIHIAMTNMKQLSIINDMLTFQF